MSPSMTLPLETKTQDDSRFKNSYHKGVKHLCDSGIVTTKVPSKYVLPSSERHEMPQKHSTADRKQSIKLPVIDFAQLQGPNRSQVLESLDKACQEYGFFQVINHGISDNVISNMIDVAKRFFELPFEERSRYMSSDMFAPVRYGTSLNQNKDDVFCWRDFLKLMCQPEALHHWPCSPMDFRKEVATYTKQTKNLFMRVMEAVLESLGVVGTTEEEEDVNQDNNVINEFQDGSQLVVFNCYPVCPEPDLTLGMPPHSDYGFLTLLLQDDVKGLQIQHQGNWVTVQPIPNSFVVNVGDHLEIFSNGKYKSVLHRVIVNPSKSRVSVASLHSLPFDSMIRPSSKLIDEMNPRKYKDTDFASFLAYITSCEPKSKKFLESRKLSFEKTDRI
ncbi:hypothetical protein ACHQM5_010126 [Ranunculus cassubicifolius]